MGSFTLNSLIPGGSEAFTGIFQEILEERKKVLEQALRTEEERKKYLLNKPAAPTDPNSLTKNLQDYPALGRFVQFFAKALAGFLGIDIGDVDISSIFQSEYDYVKKGIEDFEKQKTEIAAFLEEKKKTNNNTLAGYDPTKLAKELREKFPTMSEKQAEDAAKAAIKVQSEFKPTTNIQGLTAALLVPGKPVETQISNITPKELEEAIEEARKKGDGVVTRENLKAALESRNNLPKGKDHKLTEADNTAIDAAVAANTSAPDLAEAAMHAARAAGWKSEPALHPEFFSKKLTDSELATQHSNSLYKQVQLPAMTALGLAITRSGAQGLSVLDASLAEVGGASGYDVSLTDLQRFIGQLGGDISKLKLYRIEDSAGKDTGHYRLESADGKTGFNFSVAENSGLRGFFATLKPEAAPAPAPPVNNPNPELQNGTGILQNNTGNGPPKRN